MSEVKILTLLSGPPIIAKVDFDSKKKCYILEDPLNIIYSKKEEDDDPRISAFKVLILSAENTIEIKENNILYAYAPLPEIIDQYNRMILDKLIPIDN